MKTAHITASVAAVALLSKIVSAIPDSDLCLGSCTGEGVNEVCVFNFELDIFAGDTGYYKVDGCEGTQPTLGMREGVAYVFDQSHESNWFHPLGFAYGPDGVYGDNPELELGQKPEGGAECADDFSCQAPQYMLDGEALCDADPCAPDDFGLDQYEGVWFSGGRDDWLDAGKFAVNLTVTEPTTAELFYFCHIHNQMSGRIKVLNADGTQKDAEDKVAIPYEYEVPSDFDAECGTYNMSRYQGGEECPDMTFMCDDDLDSFGQCMVAIDCAMHVEMRVSGSLDPVTTFMHQMIAHHRNAVNMAKILLKENPASIKCGTAYDGRRLEDCNDGNDDGGAPVVTLLWEIINGQNSQITFMEAWLKDNSQPAYDFCEHKTPTPVALIGTVIGGLVAVVVAVLITCSVVTKKNEESLA